MAIKDVKNTALVQLNNFYTTTTLNRKILKRSLLRKLKIRLVGPCGSPFIPLFLAQLRRQNFRIIMHMAAEIPYVPSSSSHFQIGTWSPKQHLFDQQFCMGLVQTICKQWTKGFCEILKFWPLHSVRQNTAGFRRGLFNCFLGHTQGVYREETRWAL